MKTKLAPTAGTFGAPKSVPPLPANAVGQMQDLYIELRRIAAHVFKRERPDHTLQPTALVHEVFIRLGEIDPEKYDSKAHFFAVVTLAMRQIMVDYARRRATQKRGGGWRRVVLEEADGIPGEEFDLLALDAALERLTGFDEKLGRIVELRVFGGLSPREISSVIDRGESTIRRDWKIAKAWLQRDMRS
jgi:RNA polymerase sigma factor (TIGR02999 family)